MRARGPSVADHVGRLAIALLLGFPTSGIAQSDRIAAPSFEASLKALCPAKNLEFLDPPLLARSIREYVQTLPEEQRTRVIDAGSRTIAACAKDDLPCAIRSGLTALRGQKLAEGLAQAMCSLPYACHDWSECDKPPSTTPLPEIGRPVAPSVDTGRSLAEAAPAQPLARAPERQLAEPVQPGNGPEAVERPPRPPSARDAVTGFYEALGRGDGIAAEWFVVPEKRGSGHFVAAAMEKFYGGLAEPLQILSVEEVGSMEFRVRYRFASRAGPVCNGTSFVRVRDTPEGFRIAGIEAPVGC